VRAALSGTTLTLTSYAAGTAADYSLSSTGGDFTVSFSGTSMSGGSNGTLLPGGLSQQYTLDAWGNLLSVGNSGFTQPVNVKNQVSTFLYDAAGRLQTDANLSYTYDDDGLLLTSSNGATYVYDALGQRAQVAQGGTAKEYYYFGGQLIATLNPALGASGWTDYIYAGSEKIAVVAGNQMATPVYPLPDQIGSEAGTANSNGTSASSLNYSPFGQVVSGGGSDPFLFAGLERDSSGLDHADFRQYSPGTGRWTSPDPYDGSYNIDDPQSLNRYVYVRNNPLGYTDRSGLNALGLIANIGLCFGGTDPAGCIAEVTSGPVGWVTLGISALLEALDLAGLFDHPEFHGNVRAQNEGKATRASNSGNVKATVTQGPVLSSGNGSFTMTLGYSVPVYNPSLPAIELPSIPWGQIGAGLASVARAIPAVAASVVTLSLEGDNRGCMPSVGTQCYDEHSGHEHGGMDPHYHIYTMNQNPTTNACFWNKSRLGGGAVGMIPSGMQPCSAYPTWIP
jgi:RHS repeat-associated protein